MGALLVQSRKKSGRLCCACISSLLILVLFVQTKHLRAETPTRELFPEPTIASIFPLGGQQGTEIQLEIRGEALDGAYAVLFESQGVKAQVRNVAEIEPEGKESEDPSEESAQEEEQPPPVFRVSVQVAIDRSVPAGVHSLRLISPRGVSNALRFRVDEREVAEEANTPHSSMMEAQELTIPAIINGRISQHGRNYLLKSIWLSTLNLGLLSISQLQAGSTRTGPHDSSLMERGRPTSCLFVPASCIGWSRVAT